MGFADDVTHLRENMDILIDASRVLTPEIVYSLLKLRTIDVKILEKGIKASKNIKQNHELVQTVATGMEDIGRVVEMQNQVHFVSDARQSVSMVAGSIERVKALADSLILLDEVQGMGDEIDKVIKMKDGMKLVLENIDKIDDVNTTMSGMQDALQQMEDMYLSIKKDLGEMRLVRDEVEALNANTRMQSDLAASAVNRLRTFQVKTFMIETDRKGYSKYEPEKNTLNLFIPKGKEGDKGEPGEGRRGQRGPAGSAVAKGDDGEQGKAGRDGKNFRIDLFGNKREMKRFGNRVGGTSFLSLDESPTMIYFKKSDTLDDWTKGQPFGISDGEDANIKVTDSERLGGFTLEELMQNIQKNVERITNGSTN